MRAEYCRIERWRGYLSSSFFVRLPDRTLVESRSFRWRQQAPPPDGGAARAAYDELVGRLENAGWARHADGASWFATTFARLVEGQREIELPPVEPVPVVPPPMRAVPPVFEPPPAEPEPPVVHEPRQAQPETVAGLPEPVPAQRRAWVATLGAAIVAAAAVFGFAVRERRGNDEPVAAGVAATTVAVRAQTTTSDASTRGVAGSSHSVPAKASGVDLRVTAHGNGSWLEIRRGSRTGAILYSATLIDGQTLHYRAPRLWARFGAASNLTIVASGRTLHLQGTYEKSFVPPR